MLAKRNGQRHCLMRSGLVSTFFDEVRKRIGEPTPYQRFVWKLYNFNRRSNQGLYNDDRALDSFSTNVQS